MRAALKALLIFFILGVIFYKNSFAVASLSLSSKLQSAFASPILLITNLFKSSSFVEQMTRLQMENQSLQAQLTRQALGRGSEDDFLKAKVHAIFSFNNKGSFTIDVGSLSGVKEGMVVVVAKDVFVGQISQVSSDWSEVRTIFDIGWQIPVRIGLKNTPALLLAGVPPAISMIDKARVPDLGDDIFTAGRGIPYGLKIGNLKNMRDISGNPFKEGDVALPYVIGELAEVLVLLK